MLHEFLRTRVHDWLLGAPVKISFTWKDYKEDAALVINPSFLRMQESPCPIEFASLANFTLHAVYLIINVVRNTLIFQRVVG